MKRYKIGFFLGIFSIMLSYRYVADKRVILIFFAVFFSLPYIWHPMKKFRKKKKYLKSSLCKIDKMSGEEFELYLQAHFQKKGYYAKHVGQTGDYGADLILYGKRRRKTVVQAKRYNNSVGIKAIQEVISAKAYYDCRDAMVVTNSRFTHAAKELARKANVELWDRDRIRLEFHA